MHAFRQLPAFLAMLLAAGSAAAQATAGEWVSYRDAYRQMVAFEKYGKAKNFIQNHYQVMPKEKGVTLDGVQLTLAGKTIQLNLPLDATGRAVFPLLKAAYDENAALVLNRKLGQYTFRPRVSIVVRPDGVYEAADLHIACEQALAYQRHVAGAASSQRCVGVRFAFARRGAEAGVRVRKGDGEQLALPAIDGAAFADDPNDSFRVLDYRFAQGQDTGQVVTQDAPLAIAALFE